jgi:hypothetical protein
MGSTVAPDRTLVDEGRDGTGKEICKTQEGPELRREEVIWMRKLLLLVALTILFALGTVGTALARHADHGCPTATTNTAGTPGTAAVVAACTTGG